MNKKLLIFLSFLFVLIFLGVVSGDVSALEINGYPVCSPPTCSGSPPADCCSRNPGDCGSGTTAWTNYYGGYCALVLMPGVCDWAWQHNSCPSTDSCRGGTGLLAGLCDPAGCRVGGVYKTCCQGTTPVTCVGGDYSGFCPFGSRVEMCGYDGYPACGAAACAGIVPTSTPGPTSTPPPPGCVPSCSGSVTASIETFSVETNYTVTATNINKCSHDLRFPTWSNAGGQDDIAWYVPTDLGGGTYRMTINSASHPGEGIIFTDVWLLGSPNIFCGGDQVTRKGPTNLTVTCAAEGTSAAFCWDDTGAPKYNLRINSSYNPAYLPPPGADPYDIWTCNALTPSGGRVCQTQTVQPGLPYLNWDVASTVNCGSDRVSSSQAPAFTCLVLTPTPTPTPTVCPIPRTPAWLLPSGSFYPASAYTQVSWESVPGATGYWLRLDDQRDGWVGPLDVYVDDYPGTNYPFFFKTGATYIIWVHAGNICGLSDPIGVAAWVPTPTPAPPKCPPPPTGLVGSCPSPGNSATVSWNAVAGADFYSLRIDDQADGWDGSCWSPNGDFCLDLSATSRTFTSQPGHTYVWWVHSRRNSDGCWSDSAYGPNFYCSLPPTPTPTPTPTATPTPACPGCPAWVATTPVANNGTCNIAVSWQNVSYENGYRIYRDGVLRTTVGVNVTSWTDNGVACRGAAYSYEARPFSNDPGCSGLSCGTSAASCVCPTPTPTPTGAPGPTATPAPVVCTGCGDPAPCPGLETCDGQDICIYLQRNEGDCDCDPNCATGFCYQRSGTDYCCNPGEIWEPGLGCYVPAGPTNTPTPTPGLPTPTPPIACGFCGDPAPCPGLETCYGDICIYLQRNEGDCDCDPNCATGFCYQRSGTDYCCNPGEIWESGLGCYVPAGPTNTPTPTPPPPTSTPTATPAPVVCTGCGDPAPCPGLETCDGQDICIYLQRNEGDCDCDPNCATGFCYQRSGTDYCCNPGEIWEPGLGCYVPCTLLAPTWAGLPALVYPDVGAEVPGLTVNFAWNEVTAGGGNWGETCGPDDNHYDVYYETSANWQDHLGNVQDPVPEPDCDYVAPGIGSCTYAFPPSAEGVEYVWQIEADNGVQSTRSEINSFTIVSNPSPWFQTRAGNVHSEGDISSPIPNSCTTNPACEPYISTSDLNLGNEGVVSSTGSIDLGGGSVSEAGWESDDSFENPYSCGYFSQKLDATNGVSLIDGSVPTTTAGSGVYYTAGNVSLSGGIIPPGEKVLLFIGGDLTLTGGDFIVQPGGFLGAFVGGALNIEGSVTRVDGLYWGCDILSLISTCSDCSGGEEALDAQGIFIAPNFSLDRDLTDNNNPAEVFTYRPDLVMNAPLSIWRIPQTWEELAP